MMRHSYPRQNSEYKAELHADPYTTNRHQHIRKSSTPDLAFLLSYQQIVSIESISGH